MSLDGGLEPQRRHDYSRLRLSAAVTALPGNGTIGEYGFLDPSGGRVERAKRGQSLQWRRQSSVAPNIGGGSNEVMQQPLRNVSRWDESVGAGVGKITTDAHENGC